MEKIFKKSLALVLSAALCLTALLGCLTVSAEDAATPTYSIGKVEGKVGDTVTVTATLTNLTEVCAQHIKVTFPSVLEVGAITDGDGNAYTQLTEDTDVTGEDVIALYSKTTTAAGDTLIQFVDFVNWPNTDAVASMTIKFALTVKDTAEVGTTYDITAAVDAADYDATELLKVDIVNGSVTVKENATHEHTEATSTLVNVTDTEFVYDCTCTGCDETYQKSVKIGSPVDTAKLPYTIEPKNDMSILCEFLPTAVEGYKNITLVAKKETYSPNDSTPTLTPKYLTEYKPSEIYSGYYEFVYSDIGSYEMSNEITFTLYGLNTDGEMVRLVENTRSIVGYVTSQLKKVTAANAKKLFVDILNYGTYMQLMSSQNVQNLANASLTDEQKSWGTPVSEYPTVASQCNSLSKAETTTQILSTTTEIGEVKISKSIEPASKTNIQFVLTNSADKDLSNLYCKFDYYKMKGVKETLIAKYSNQYFPGTGYPMFVFSEAPVSMIDYPVSATIYYGDPDNGGVALSKVSYSVETYIASRLSKDTGDKLLALQSMYAYGNSLALYSGIVPYSAD